MLFGYLFFLSLIKHCALCSVSLFVAFWNSQHLNYKVAEVLDESQGENPDNIGMLVLKVKQEPGLEPAALLFNFSLV